MAVGTIGRVNSALYGDLTLLEVRDYPVDKTSAPVDPDDAKVLVDGEWLYITGGKATRAAAAPLKVPSYPVFGEKGRSDVQAIEKVPLIFGGGAFEFETQVYDDTGPLAVGDAVMVDKVTIPVGGVDRSGLKKATTSNFVVGRVTKLPSGGAGLKVRVHAEGIMP